jgi:hypothetical protein
VQESYRVYARRKAEDLTNERVQGWLNDREISAFLKEFSLEKSSAARVKERRPE